MLKLLLEQPSSLTFGQHITIPRVLQVNTKIWPNWFSRFEQKPTENLAKYITNINNFSFKL